MRTEINYKKEGFTQIFPILRIKNDKEKVIVIGFGKKNIAFVIGENDSYKELLKNEPDNSSFFKGNGLNQISKLDNKQKIIIAALFIGVIGVAYLLIKKNRR